MATIVQPYNPWRENLAAGIIGPILSHILQSSQEANQNRKMNAALGAIQSSLGGQNTPSQNQSISPYSRPQMPEGNTPWERASSRMLDPLIQFNPEASLVSASPQRNIPTQSDYLSAMTNTLATDRFSMLNRDAVAKALDPMIQASLDAQRKMNLQNGINSLNKLNDKDRLDTLLGMAINGFVSPELYKYAQSDYQHNNPSTLDMLKLAESEKDRNLKRYIAEQENNRANNRLNFDYYQHNNPKYQIDTLDTGEAIKPYSFNPGTGEMFELGNYPKTLSPKDVADIASKNSIENLKLEQKQKELLFKNNSERMKELVKEIQEIQNNPSHFVENQELALEIIEKAREEIARLNNVNNALFSKQESSNNGYLPPIPEEFRSADPLLGSNNVSNDVEPQIQPQPQTKTQEQNANNNNSYVVPPELLKEIMYDPQRDANIDPSMVYTPEHFNKWVNTLMNDPNLSQLSPDELLRLVIQQGFKVRR